MLHAALTRRLPGIAFPSLFEKNYLGRFSDDFVEAMTLRDALRSSCHPVARYGEILTPFLSCEGKQTNVALFLVCYARLTVCWNGRRERQPATSGSSLPPTGPSFYLINNVLHPDSNFDAEEATDDVYILTKVVDSGLQGLRNVFTQIRQAR